MSVREDIAAALSTVDGVTGYAYRPDTARSGDGWALLSRLERDAATTFMVTWRVLVLLSPDERTASHWIDAHATLLFEALEPVAFVGSFEPVEVPIGGSTQLALQIMLRRE